MVHGEVKRSFDPKFFEWKRGEEGWGAKTDMKIRISERGKYSFRQLEPGNSRNMLFLRRRDFIVLKLV